MTVNMDFNFYQSSDKYCYFTYTWTEKILIVDYILRYLLLFV